MDENELAIYDAITRIVDEVEDRIERLAMTLGVSTEELADRITVELQERIPD